MTKRLFLAAAAVAVLALTGAVACKSDGGEKTTPAPTATTASDHGTPNAMASPATQAELQAAFETARTQLQELITKAQASDLQGARDAYTPADDPLHMIEDALASKDTSLATSIESKQHDGVEDPLNSGSPDLAAIAQAAQDILPLLDQAATKLDITAGEVDTAKLSSDLTEIRTVMQETKTKALAGDVQGTRDAEGRGDVAIEAIIDAIRPTESALADSIEKLELDYEGQADSDNPDLTVIADDAQKVLDLMDQVASQFNITP